MSNWRRFIVYRKLFLHEKSTAVRCPSRSEARANSSLQCLVRAAAMLDVLDLDADAILRRVPAENDRWRAVFTVREGHDSEKNQQQG